MIVVEETLEDLQWRLRATDDDDDDYDDDRSNLTTPSVPRLLNTIVLCATGDLNRLVTVLNNLTR